MKPIPGYLGWNHPRQPLKATSHSVGFPRAPPAAHPTRNPPPPAPCPPPPVPGDSFRPRQGPRVQLMPRGSPPTRACSPLARLLTGPRPGRRVGRLAGMNPQVGLDPAVSPTPSAPAPPRAGVTRRAPRLARPPGAQRAVTLASRDGRRATGKGVWSPQGPSRATGTGGPRFPNASSRPGGSAAGIHPFSSLLSASGKAPGSS